MTCNRSPDEFTVRIWTPASASVRATSWASASSVPTSERFDATLEAALAIAASRRSRSRLRVTSRKETIHRPPAGNRGEDVGELAPLPGRRLPGDGQLPRPGARRVVRRRERRGCTRDVVRIQAAQEHGGGVGVDEACLGVDDREPVRGVAHHVVRGDRSGRRADGGPSSLAPPDPPPCPDRDRTHRGAGHPGEMLTCRARPDVQRTSRVHPSGAAYDGPPRRLTHGGRPIRLRRCRHITVPGTGDAGHDEGMGATARTLPCRAAVRGATDSPRGELPRARPVQRENHVKRALTVRDAASRDSLRKAFDDLGYEVIPFKKTEQAVARARAEGRAPDGDRLPGEGPGRHHRPHRRPRRPRLHGGSRTCRPSRSATARTSATSWPAAARPGITDVFVVGGDPTDEPTEFRHAHDLLVALHDSTTASPTSASGVIRKVIRRRRRRRCSRRSRTRRRWPPTSRPRSCSTRSSS